MLSLILFAIVVVVAAAVVCFAGSCRQGLASRPTGGQTGTEQPPEARARQATFSEPGEHADEDVFSWLPTVTGIVLFQLALLFLFLWAAGGVDVHSGFPLALFPAVIAGCGLACCRRRGGA